MVFAGGLNYKLPLQSPETAYIWDVGGQAITSGNFNTTISTDTNSVDLFHDDVLGANENFYDCNVHETTPSYATGRLAVDSGATLTIFNAGLKAHLQNTRNSRASIQGFAGTARTLADWHGTAHMFIVHPTDSSLCEHLTLPGDVVTEASQGLLSAYDMCRGQGFTLVLDDGNSDAFVVNLIVNVISKVVVICRRPLERTMINEICLMFGRTSKHITLKL